MHVLCTAGMLNYCVYSTQAITHMSVFRWENNSIQGIH